MVGNKNFIDKKSRRITVDSVPSAKKLVASSENSFNFSNSENNLTYDQKKCSCSYKKDESSDDDDDDDSSIEEQNNTKL